ncbi:hypothetical protein B0H10DRAFT_2165465 [Mycena sp. CBHHK59/15]|nr:hypothetical protein B0H10DRAFT_2165465 [Mycena sp. CBHHK59/15]
MATTSPSRFAFSEWPPALSVAQLEDLTLYATTYALSHGLLYLPPVKPQPLIPKSAIHAPLSLFPSPFPRRLFALARRLQSSYNTLYARIATDVEFLDKVMGGVEGVGRVDDFVGQLWAGWKNLRDAGLVQPLQLGLFRSDYLLHAGRKDEPLTLKQVEFNTISSSFGTLSQRTAALHRYLYASTSYHNVSPDIKAENFPPNDTTAGLVEGLAAAHAAYNVKEAKILFVVQAGERNVFDQRLLEYELLEKHAIHVIRQTFDELAQTAARSRAIKCPSIALQLAGGKKVQQVLTQPGQLDGHVGLDEDAGVQKAREMADKLVLKPQREGGGNNVYKDEIPSFLDTLAPLERQRGSPWNSSCRQRNGQLPCARGRRGRPARVKVDVVSELGIFGGRCLAGRMAVSRRRRGWLVRTKGKDSNEGGVATGFSVLDSLLLVDD